MAKLPERYDPNAHDPQDGDFDAIPPGIYTVEVSDSEVIETNAGDPAVKYEFTVLGPKFSGRKLWHTFNLYHSTSAQARQIAEGQHSAMCRAMGWLQPVEDTEVLHGRVCDVKVKIRTYTHNGEERKDNDIKAFKAVSGGAPSPGAGGGGGGNQPWNQPSGGAQPPAQAPQAPAAPPKPPSPPQAPQAAQNPTEGATEGQGGEGATEGASVPPWLR